MNSWNPVVRSIVVGGLLVVGGIATGRAQASVPDPKSSSCPPNVYVTPGATCCFDVIVRDLNSNPVGGSTVVVDFGTSCTASFCPAQPPGIVTAGNTASTTTNASGVAHFCICGTFSGPPVCYASVRADGVFLCNVPVSDDCSPPHPYDHWNHYKLYATTPVPPPANPLLVQLQDEFNQPFTHQVLQLDYWMGPTAKTVIDATGQKPYFVQDGSLTYTWWKISPQPNTATVALSNQFGDQTLLVKDAEYLLNPALMNQTKPQPLPTANHYKCYACEGQPINRTVVMQDVFNLPNTPGWSATVTYPRWFCNPAVKSVQGGPGPDPIIDPTQHYVCYEYVPSDPGMHSITFTDQFYLQQPTNAGPSQWICVPTIKYGFTVTKRSSWGMLKLLYR